MSSNNSDDEFRRTIGDVRPLKSAKQRIAPPRKPLPVEPVDRQTEDYANPRAGPPVEIGQTAGVDRRTAERLRRGKLHIDARLDLHGYTQAAAHSALTAFVTDGAAQGHRCVLVVTGKGPVGQGGGVLRRQVPEWLNLPPCRGLVLAIAESQPQHGGSGALYVLLRRNREGDRA